LESTVCDIQGVYTFTNISLWCRDEYDVPPFAACPDDTPEVSFSFVVMGTDFCDPTALDVTQDNTFNITIFADESRTEMTDVFSVGDMAYLTLSIISPDVSIDSLDLQSLELISVNNPSMVDNIFPLSAAQAADVSFVYSEEGSSASPGNPAIITVQFMLLRSAFTQTIGLISSTELYQVVDLEATVNIFYHQQGKKRSAPHSVTLSAQLKLTSNGSEEKEAGAVEDTLAGENGWGADGWLNSSSDTTYTPLSSLLFATIMVITLLNSFIF